MRILLTNDDGIHAPGIQAAYKALASLGEVFVVAPERQRSAAGHAITLHKPLRIHKVALANGNTGYATSGTPTDCVTLGYEIVMERRCDLVVSGINAGANLGWDLTYSGTVAAAIEGAVLGLPALAVSCVLPEENKLENKLENKPEIIQKENKENDKIGDTQVDFEFAAEITRRIVERLCSDPLPQFTFLNINVPSVDKERLKGIAVTHQGRREYVDRILTRFDPAGRPYYWQAGSIREDTPDRGSDVHAILHNQISVTPVQLDMTDYPLMDRLDNWKLDNWKL